MIPRSLCSRPLHRGSALAPVVNRLTESYTVGWNAVSWHAAKLNLWSGNFSVGDGASRWLGMVKWTASLIGEDFGADAVESTLFFFRAWLVEFGCVEGSWQVVVFCPLQIITALLTDRASHVFQQVMSPGDLTEVSDVNTRYHRLL